MSNRKRLKLNMKFNRGKVVCAKSPDQCKECKDIKLCETIDTFYYPYSKKDIKECFSNSERRR